MCYTPHGDSALEMMVRERPDVVILDLALEPGRIDGWEVARAKLRDERIASIPMIVTTALSAQDVEDREVPSDPLGGCLLMLGKPVDTRRLDACLDLVGARESG